MIFRNEILNSISHEFYIQRNIHNVYFMHMRNRESDPSIFHRDKEQKEPLNKRYQVCRSCREFLGQSKPSDMSRAPTNCQEISFTKKN